jgi:hypothetical protein
MPPSKRNVRLKRNAEADPLKHSTIAAVTITAAHGHVRLRVADVVKLHAGS